MNEKIIHRPLAPIVACVTIAIGIWFLALLLNFQSIQISNSVLEQTTSRISYAAIIVFALTFSNSLIYISAFLSLNFTPRPDRSIFNLFSKRKFQKGKVPIKIKVLFNKKAIPFSDITVFDEAENKLAVFHANIFAVANLRLPEGKYILQASNFGFEGRATGSVEVAKGKMNFIELECLPKHDLQTNPRSNKYIIFSKIFYALLSVASIALFFYAQKFAMNFTSLLLLMLGLINILVFSIIKNGRIIVRDHRGARLKKKKFTISDPTGKKKLKFTSSNVGSAIILASPGIYTIKTKGYSPRNVRVSKRSVLSADLKLF